MGFLRDLIAAKEEIWRGSDYAVYESNCKTLKDAGFKIQACKINTQMEGCTGDCAGCSTCAEMNREVREETPKEFVPDEYAIYVKQADAIAAKQLIYILR